MPIGEQYANGYHSGHADDETHRVVMILSSWFRAMEDGTAVLRLPNPAYVRPEGKPDWTEEHLEKFIKALDDDIQTEAGTSPGTKMGATAGPGFSRLTWPQRLALVQELEQALEPRTAAPPVTTYDPESGVGLD